MTGATTAVVVVVVVVAGGVAAASQSAYVASEPSQRTTEPPPAAHAVSGMVPIDADVLPEPGVPLSKSVTTFKSSVLDCKSLLFCKSTCS